MKPPVPEGTKGVPINDSVGFFLFAVLICVVYLFVNINHVVVVVLLVLMPDLTNLTTTSKTKSICELNARQ